MTVVYRTDVHLGTHVWGNCKMELAARMMADYWYGERPLLVVVYEHGGWWLEWLFERGEVNPLLVGTANDSAVFSERVKSRRSWLSNRDETTIHRLVGCWVEMVFHERRLG